MILVDARPLIALLDADDQYHWTCTIAFRSVHEAMATVWPALTEAMHYLAHVPRAQDRLMEMVQAGLLAILPLDRADAPRIRELMDKYADLPMDLADAALIRVAERERIRTIFTIDKKDFSVYRLHGKLKPKLIP